MKAGAYFGHPVLIPGSRHFTRVTTPPGATSLVACDGAPAGYVNSRWPVPMEDRRHDRGGRGIAWAGHRQVRGEPVATTKQKRTADEIRLPESEFAFPDERKEPLGDAGHVRNAIARFDQVEGVSDAERDRAWKRILSAAEKFDVEVSADDWRELMRDGKSDKR
jgi:hypothetical protein